MVHRKLVIPFITSLVRGFEPVIRKVVGELRDKFLRRETVSVKEQQMFTKHFLLLLYRFCEETTICANILLRRNNFGDEAAISKKKISLWRNNFR